MLCKTFALLFLGAIAIPSLQATVLYGNYGSAMPGGGGQAKLSNTYGAVRMVATGSGSLSSITTWLDDETNAVATTAALYSDTAGEPGALLESWTLNIPFGNGFTWVPTTLTSLADPTITAGSTYWFVITNPGTSTTYWERDDQGDKLGWWSGSTLTALAGVAVGSKAQLGIELDGTTSTPEPTTFALLALGLPVLWRLRRARA